MNIKKIGIIGLGTIGEGVVRSLHKYSSLIFSRTGIKIDIVGLCDKDKTKKKLAQEYSLPFTEDAYSLINNPDIDIIVELIGGIKPASTFIIEALRNNKCVVTANKALLAECGREIFAQAKKYQRYIGFEASVCGAIPLIKSISEGLISCSVKNIYGILNGTTNYILDKMEKEALNFHHALLQAQKKGFAERNPSLDIEGKDTLHKLCILSYLCFGVWPPMQKIITEGISNIHLCDIIYSKELGYRIKLLAIAKQIKNKLDLRIHPTLIPYNHPLSDVSLAYNAVYLDTEPAGNLLFYGLGAGGSPTSSAIISDIIDASFKTSPHFLRKKVNLTLANPNSITMRHYIRMLAKDTPGVLEKIAHIFAYYNISIASVNQKESKKDKYVPIIMLTHKAPEGDLVRALSEIDKLSVVKKPSQRIRIEDL